MDNRGEIIIYQSRDGQASINVRLENETVWLHQKQISELFGTEVPAISKHIKNIIKSHELETDSTISKMEIVRMEGKREVRRIVDHYNLDMIISIGYRINSIRGTQFRIWANKILKD